MSNYCFVAPILPGGADKMRIWFRDELNNSADHDRVMRQVGISREQVWIQHTPMGDFAVASWETNDASQTFRTLTNSNDPWSAKYRNLLSEVHGIDFSKGIPVNEQLGNWHAMERVHA